MKKQTETEHEKTITDLTWGELLARREILTASIEELEAEKKVLSDEFLFRLQEEKTNGKVVGNWSISKATRYSFETTMAEARELGAVKETIDASVLKQQHLKGIKVPGVKKIEYAIVREVVKAPKE